MSTPFDSIASSTAWPNSTCWVRCRNPATARSSGPCGANAESRSAALGDLRKAERHEGGDLPVGVKRGGHDEAGKGEGRDRRGERPRREPLADDEVLDFHRIGEQRLERAALALAGGGIDRDRHAAQERR